MILLAICRGASGSGLRLTFLKMLAILEVGLERFPILSDPIISLQRTISSWKKVDGLPLATAIMLLAY